MEPLPSSAIARVFDHIAWAVDVMKRVNSLGIKILYDNYQAQIHDGDTVRTSAAIAGGSDVPRLVEIPAAKNR